MLIEHSCIYNSFYSVPTLIHSCLTSTTCSPSHHYINILYLRFVPYSVSVSYLTSIYVRSKMIINNT